MQYIKDCFKFFHAEEKETKKEFGRLVSLSEGKRLQEGMVIAQAEVIEVDEESGTAVLKFPPQFTKIREEKSVAIFKSVRKVKDGDLVKSSAEVKEIDLLNNTITLYGRKLEIGNEYYLIENQGITPAMIIRSLSLVMNNPSDLAKNLVDKKANCKMNSNSSITSIIDTVDRMDNSYMIIQGPPGAGKSFTARKIINHLLLNGKTVLATSNSHSAINNLIDGVAGDINFQGIKITSKPKQSIKHDLIKNGFFSKKQSEDVTIQNHQLVAGTCFALSRIGSTQFDYLIVDEASQLKMSFLLAVSRLVKNVIILGDQNQLQSISVIPESKGGESVLNYLLDGQRVVPKDQGYFLNKTYRMEPQIAKVISDVFYQSELKWAKQDLKEGVKLVTAVHFHGQKLSREEGEVAVEIYKDLISKNVSPEEIMIVTPYNAQVSLLRSLIPDLKVRIGTVDLFQGTEADHVLISMVCCGKNEDSSEFVTNPNRLNVAISRAKESVHLIASPGLQEAEKVSEEFKSIIRMVS